MNYPHRKFREKKKNPLAANVWRLNLLSVIAVLFSVAIIFKLFDTQIIRGNYYQALASGQHQMYEDLIPSRGTVYIEDRFSKSLYPLAVNKKLSLIFAVPKQIKDQEETALRVAAILELDKTEVLAKLSKKDDLYEPLQRRVTDEKKKEIEEAHLKGVYTQPEETRYYTENQFAAQVLGFLGYDGDKRLGRYGVEGFYEEKLAGKKGFIAAEKDAAGQLVIGGEKLFSEALDGDSLVLSIDRVMQYKVEKILEEAVKKYKAEEGSVIIMNPENGEITALANYPNFNPNEYSKVEDIGLFTNSAIYDLYEPGSTFKPIIMAAAVNTGLVGPSTTVVDETGELKIDKYTLHNSDFAAHGKMTMTQVLEKSSNIGMAKVAEMLGKERTYQYLERFGFTELTGIDMASEAETKIPKTKAWNKVLEATVAYGQGIAITPLQLVNATAAFANGGKIVKPHVVKKIVHANGKEEVAANDFQREAISSSTAETMAAMMVSAVENGYGKAARVPGYRIAGKTGTAQVANKDKKGYDPNQKIASFVGFGPVENPQFVMLVKINNPGGDVWGESTAAPVFGKIAAELFKYYQIPPTLKTNQ